MEPRQCVTCNNVWWQTVPQPSTSNGKGSVSNSYTLWLVDRISVFWCWSRCCYKEPNFSDFFVISDCVIISLSDSGWLGGVVVSVSDSRSRGPGFNSWLGHRQATNLVKLLTPMCLCHQAVQFGTGQRAVMLCGWEGNRRSGIALAMWHRL